ncbi:hypothetical protein J7T55_014726 [Diaporthe amygdali]|uniref:uncharacterized protein n=1 Tax=Phomopsis amygdali TaxID=1214568 RepID=UPI0022FDDF0A|nr:uncharacterized protein J7T55_014726 [Diaporthe amygdali]KAJ0109925.1 hypothetical protein J7T55_014726 [Diaporthe amygdali]
MQALTDLPYQKATIPIPIIFLTSIWGDEAKYAILLPHLLIEFQIGLFSSDKDSFPDLQSQMHLIKEVATDWNNFTSIMNQDLSFALLLIFCQIIHLHNTENFISHGYFPVKIGGGASLNHLVRP